MVEDSKVERTPRMRAQITFLKRLIRATVKGERGVVGYRGQNAMLQELIDARIIEKVDGWRGKGGRDVHMYGWTSIMCQEILTKYLPAEEVAALESSV